MNANEQAPARAWPSKTWLTVHALICIAIVVRAAWGLQRATGNVALDAGYALPFALLIAGGLYFLFRKREPADAGWYSLFAIYAAFIVAVLIAHGQYKREMQVAAGEMENAVKTLGKEISGGPGAADTTLSTTPSAKGDAGKMEAIIRRVVSRMLALRKDYEQELNAAGWPQVLEAERLRQDTTLAQGKAIVKQAQAIVAQYRARNDAVFTEIREEIEKADLDFITRQQALAGFDKSFAQNKARAAEVWEMEAQIVGLVDELISLLGAKRGKWRVEDNKLAFFDQATLDQYNARMASINRIVGKQQEIQQAQLQTSIDKFKSLAK